MPATDALVVAAKAVLTFFGIVAFMAASVYGSNKLSAWLDARYLRKVAAAQRLGAPPPGRVTVRLAFNGLKSKVCRPFSA